MIFATICPDSPRHRAWLEIFGADTVPILSPWPQEAEGPHGRALFYQADVRRLALEVRARLVRHLAAKFDLTESEVARDLDGAEGLPILAEGVLVSFDARLFL